MFRKIVIFLFLFIKITLSQNIIGLFDFENNIIDPYGNLSTREWYNGTAEGIVTYVTGYTGLAARTSHNSDDGGDDFGIMLPSTWTESRERYIKFWLKYESNYWGDCGGIWNIKWVWTAGSEAHNELIFQYYSSGNIGLTWQLIGGVSHWSNGSNLKYGSSFPYTFGNWMFVEIYFHLSSGANYDQADGIQWVKINGNYIINDSGVTTGLPGQMYSPALKASCDCPSGQGWWQIDEYELWDGLPNSNSPPGQVQGIKITK